MKNSDNIEQLFKETFEKFEADVNPRVWQGVQNGINNIPGSSSSAAAKASLGKIIASTVIGAASLAVVAGGIWYFSSSDNRTNSPLPASPSPASSVSKEISQNNISSENNSSNEGSFSRESKQPSSTSYSSSGQHSSSQQTSVVSSQSTNANTADVVSSENEGGASPIRSQVKYGNSTNGPTPLIRGSQSLDTKKKQSDSGNHSTTNEPEAEQAPIANIITNIESGDAPLTVNFSNSATAGSLSWDFDDGSGSGDLSPTHTFEKPGSYTVKVTAKNSAATVSDTKTIEVKAISGIEFNPDIFTPNGDGKNDVLEFKLKNIASIKVIISNLSGQEITSWSTVDGNWNGKLRNGEEAPDGLYFYIIQATGTDSVSYNNIKGSVTLKR